jgi:acetolactate synthase-like protein
MNGGDIIAQVLQAQGVEFLFTLCGGHISPILVGCKRLGIRVVDTRHEATAVYAADAVSRLTGRPGVAAVTAGPGVTNTITALKNAQLAGSPLVLLGGAAPTALQGRGALQDIDQMALVRPHVKSAVKVRRVRDLAPVLQKAFFTAQNGMPGPVFVECAIDLLYDEETVRQMYGAGRGRGLAGAAVNSYLQLHVNRLFAGAGEVTPAGPVEVTRPEPRVEQVQHAVSALVDAQRPLILVGSQAVLDARAVGQVAADIERIGAPAYLSGMARGLLGRDNPLQMRHRRREALREADLVILAGVPADFRLDYGRHIRRGAFCISANLDRRELFRNRRPDLAAQVDPGRFLRALADALAAAPTAAALPVSERWAGWRGRLAERDAARDAEIQEQRREPTGDVNPLHLLGEIDGRLAPGAIVIGDGGDFVGSASYIVRPTGPLCWLDPGPFGTLGVGAGFALGAKLCRPESEVWVLFGDGAAGYSLAEFDTFARHGVPVIAVVGNDGSWSQIAREQVDLLGDDVGTILARTDYERVVEGCGAVGLRVEDPELVPQVLAQARAAAASGRPVLVNALIGQTGFRKGSISM